jgi:hypothetical protein
MFLPNLKMFRVSVAGKRIGLASFECNYYTRFVEEFKVCFEGYADGRVEVIVPALRQRLGTGRYEGPV